jgi:PleD family two-component response regulator
MQPFLVRLHAALRDSDVIGRLRADALTVLMPGLPAQHAPAVLARLCIAVDDVAEQQGLVFHAGVATAEGGEEIAALFARAEAAALRFGIGSNEEFAHK